MAAWHERNRQRAPASGFAILLETTSRSQYRNMARAKFDSGYQVLDLTSPSVITRHRDIAVWYEQELTAGTRTGIRPLHSRHLYIIRPRYRLSKKLTAGTSSRILYLRLRHLDTVVTKYGTSEDRQWAPASEFDDSTRDASSSQH